MWSATEYRLDSRETGDGLTGTDSGGSLDQIESIGRWSRETVLLPSSVRLLASWRLDRVGFQSIPHSVIPSMKLTSF